METHESNKAQGHGDFERRDIGGTGVIYFFVAIVAATLVAAFLLVCMYKFLDKRSNAEQAPVNPLVTNAPADTRHVRTDYPNSAFPEPRLEKNERTQFNDVISGEEQTLNSYGWLDEKSKTVRIPIERAMDLIAQRGLPVRPQEALAAPTAASKPAKGNNQKGNKK
jgi:hypothetical protein